MNRQTDRLFTQGDLSNLNQAQAVSQHLDKIPKIALLSTPQDQIIANSIASLTIQPLEIDESSKTQENRDVKVDVRGDPLRITWGEGPCLLSGTQLTISIPYRGDSQLWNYRPNTFYMSPRPNGRIISQGPYSGLVQMIIEFPNDDPPDRVRSRIAENLQYLKQCLAAQKLIIDQYNASLSRAVQDGLNSRMSQIRKQSDILESLGIPPKNETSVAQPKPATTIRHHVPVSPANQRPQPPNAKPSAPRPALDQWDAFISHASEDKDAFVRDLANALTKAGLQIWYDEFTLTIGDSLRRSIDNGLAKSRFGIVVLSHSFFAKDWPQKELDGLVAKEETTHKVILPVWHGLTKDDVGRYSPILADRLAVSTDKGIAHIVAQILRATGKVETT